MRRNSEEIAETILRRVEIKYRKDKLRKEKRKAAALTAICFAGCLALAVCLIALPLFYSGAGLSAAQGSVIVCERAVVGGYALNGGDRVFAGRHGCAGLAEPEETRRPPSERYAGNDGKRRLT